MTGLVIAADTGAPAKRVTIALSGNAALSREAMAAVTAVARAAAAASGGRGVASPTFVQRSTETDAAGRFTFTGLPAGRFTITPNVRSGFVRTNGESVELTDGGTAAVTFRLERTGAIAGRVLDESGEPFQGASVRVARWESLGGVRRQTTYYSSGNETNDLGEYRAYNLPPGEYFVSAVYNRYDFNQADPGAPKTEPSNGFAPTFYPGTTSPEQARTISVRAGQTIHGIDFPFVRTQMGRVVVIVSDASGAPIGTSTNNVNVGLSLRSEVLAQSSGMSRQRDGSFRSNDLPPGDYYVWALGGGPSGPGQGPVTQEGGFTPVTVNGDEQTAYVQMNRGATISGRVVVEGKMPDLSSIPGGRGGPMRISVSPRTTMGSGGYVPAMAVGRGATAAEDGSFEITGLRGRMRIMASGPLLALKSVRAGGRDILSTPIELTGVERMTDVEIVMTSEVGSLTGTVTNAKGEPASGAAVVVFSDDPDQWFEASPFIRQLTTPTAPTSSAAPGTSGAGGPVAPSPGGVAAPSGSVSIQLPSGMAPVANGPGQFSATALVPGRYLVAAFERYGTTGPAYDPEALEKLRSRATSVTVVAGQKAQVELKTIKQ